MRKPAVTVMGVVAALVVAGVAYFTQPGMKAGGTGAQSAAPAAGREAGAAKQALTAPPSSTRGTPPTAAPTQAGKGGEEAVRFGLKAPRPRTPGTIRVTTFNIENLFDDHDDPALTGSGDDKDMTKPLADMQAAAAAIRAVDPDVLCLQEVESEQAVRWFADAHLKGMGYEHIVSVDAGDPRGIEQAVLSRFPIKDVKTYVRKNLGGTQPARWGREENREAGQPFEFKRTPLRFTVVVPDQRVAELLKKAGKAEARAKDYELTVFNVHLKSGRDFDEQRGAEAGGVVELIKELERLKPSANVLVLGDFNATLNQPALQVFNKAGIESIWNDRNPRDTATMTHASARCIDHIYATRNVRPELVMESRFVLGLPARPEGSDWRTTPAPAGYASDHYPVSIDLRPVESN